MPPSIANEGVMIAPEEKKNGGPPPSPPQINGKSSSQNNAVLPALAAKNLEALEKGANAEAEARVTDFAGLEEIPPCSPRNMSIIMTRSIENLFYR